MRDSFLENGARLRRMSLSSPSVTDSTKREAAPEGSGSGHDVV